MKPLADLLDEALAAGVSSITLEFGKRATCGCWHKVKQRHFFAYGKDGKTALRNALTFALDEDVLV